MKIPKEITKRFFFTNAFQKWGFYLFCIKFYEDGSVFVPYFISICVGRFPDALDSGFSLVVGYPQILQSDKDMIKGLHIRISKFKIKRALQKIKSKIQSYFV